MACILLEHQDKKNLDLYYCGIFSPKFQKKFNSELMFAEFFTVSCENSEK